MYNKEQITTANWNNFTKKHYEERGYTFTKIFDEFEVRAKDLLPTSKSLIIAVCDYCGKEKQVSMNDYMRNTKNETVGFSCADRECTNKKNKEIRYASAIDKAFKIFEGFCKEHGYIPISTVSDYKNAKSKMKFVCNKHGEQSITVDSIKRGCSCNLCGNEKIAKKLSLEKEEVIKRVESKNGNKILNPEDYINSSTKNLKIICGSCKNMFITSMASLNNSGGMCPSCGVKKCTSNQRLTKEDLEKRINGNILLNPEDYISNGKRNLKFKCEICGEVFIASLANYEAGKTVCNNCSQRISKGELKISKILKKYDIDFEPEKRFEDCRDIKPLPFDFYLKDYNAIIEFDGQHHFKEIEHRNSLEYVQSHDAIKNKYCEENGIKLIRIPYYKGNYIEEIILSELKINNNLEDIV